MTKNINGKKGKRIRIVISCFLLAILLIIGIFFAFIFSGKSKALNLEIEAINIQEVPDGTYTSNYSGFRWSNTVEVTVTNHQITDIQIIKPQVFAKEETMNILIGKLQSEKNLEVDAVTGATADSKAFLAAVENALKKALLTD